MADIQYLNYGDLQIELLALLNTLADLVEGYVQKLAWSKKRKEKFMSAYSDLMNHGILGASNNTGLWMVDVGGSIDLDSMEKKDKEMYQEAAYFIRKQMAGLPTKSSLEEEKKAKIKKFDFNTDFITHVNNTINGGKSLTIGYGDSDLWNYLDERDANGIRGRKNRANKLADLLKSYDDKLGDGSEYDFEGSPYTDINDFRTKLNKAVSALRTDSIDDDREALQAIGLNQADWFNNGSGDPSGKAIDGNQLTYGLLAEYNKAVEEAKQKEIEELKLALLKKAYDNTIFFDRVTSPKMHGRSPLELKEKYGDGNTLMSVLLLYAQSNIKQLTPDLLSELHGAYRFLAKDPIDLKLLKLLQTSSSGLYRNAALNRFKKINGIDNLIWDSAAGQIIQVQTRDEYNAIRSATAINNSGKDLFTGIKTNKEKELDYLNSKIPGVTNAEWKELASIAGDIASIVDPEPITAGMLGLGAAELRREAINETPGHKWTLAEGVGQGIDYLTGGLAAIPVLGDIGLGVKLALKSNRWIPIVTKAFRMIARAGAWKDLADSVPGILAAYNKMTKGEELTVGDWRAIAQGIRGIAGHGMLNKGNRATRKVLEESGYTTIPSNTRNNVVTRELAREGFFGSKIEGETSIPTLKLKKVDSDGKVVERKQVDLELSQLETLRKTKPSELDTKAKELLREKIPEGYTVDVNTGWRAKGKNLIPYTKKNSSAFSTKSVEIEKGNDNFETWLNNRGAWSKMYYGWNPRMRTIREGLNISSTSGIAPQTNNNLKKPILALPNKNPLVSNSPLDRSSIDVNPLDIRKGIQTPPPNYGKINLAEREVIESFLLSYGLGGLKSTPMRNGFRGNAVKAGKYEHDLLTIRLSKNKSKLLRNNPRKLAEFREENAKKILSLIDTKKATDKEIVEIIKGLKKKGYLKQGGRITDSQIDNFLRQYK